MAAENPLHQVNATDFEKIALVIEKRVRKDCRSHKWFQKGSKVLLINDDSTEYHVEKAILQSILKEMPLTIEEKKVGIGWEKDLLILAKDYDRVVIPKDMDDEILGFFEALFFNKQVENIPEDKIITILGNVSDAEVIAYAKAKNLPLKGGNKDSLAEKLDQFEQRYPGIKFSIKKSIEELRKEE
ncbi:hypothetical protein J4457_01325 [Candidatus Woesearchaeota archaeon]|nr:hypothetical protein [Candidatus Woesearchaeota archaeon]